VSEFPALVGLMTGQGLDADRPDRSNVNAAPGVYPNTVPVDNLRLPDALTIEHGPSRFLAHFILEGDKAARRMDVRLRLRHDFKELAYINQKHTRSASWYPLIDALDPEVADLAPENSFWLSGENSAGDVVTTWVARIYDWRGTNLAEQARTLWYGRDLGQPCEITADAATLISGVVVVGGAFWVRPDFRGKHLSFLVPRIGKAYACARWPIDWSFCYIGIDNVRKGLAANYGQKYLSYSVLYPGSPQGEQVIAYTPIQEVYEDFANFIAVEGEGARGGSADFGLAFAASTSREHIVTNTSSVGVLHGSNKRS
jgi:hypothetical protein